jgi:hypothetical protein
VTPAPVFGVWDDEKGLVFLCIVSAFFGGREGGVPNAFSWGRVVARAYSNGHGVSHLVVRQKGLGRRCWVLPVPVYTTR